MYADVFLAVAALTAAEVVDGVGDGDGTVGDDVADVGAPPELDAAEFEVEFKADELPDVDDGVVAERVPVVREVGTLSGEPHAVTVRVSTEVAARAARRLERDTRR